MNELTTKNEMLPDFLGNFSGDDGFNTVDQSCVSLPFLRLSQSNTPAVVEKKIESGVFYNTATMKVYGANARFIILGFYKAFVEWDGEGEGAKFVRSISADIYESEIASTCHRDEKTGKILTAKGTRIVDCRNFFVMNADVPEDGIMLYVMSSTGIPASKKWLSLASGVRIKTDAGIVRAPMWASVWKLSTEFTRNDKGSFYQVKDVEKDGWISAVAKDDIENAFASAQAYIEANNVSLDTAQAV